MGLLHGRSNPILVEVDVSVDVADLGAELDSILRLPGDERARPLARLGRKLLENGRPGADKVVGALITLIDEGTGEPQARARCSASSAIPASAYPPTPTTG
jgi:hypothetical protein